MTIRPVPAGFAWRLGQLAITIPLFAATARAQVRGIYTVPLNGPPPLIEVRVPFPPILTNTERGGLLVYELHVTNLSLDTLTLERVEAIDGRDSTRVLSLLSDSTLRRAVGRRPAASIPPTEWSVLRPGLRAIVFFWIDVDTSGVSATITHRVFFRRHLSDSASAFVQGAVTPVLRGATVIAAPLDGEWKTDAGPSRDSRHRRGGLTPSGTFVIPERYTSDFRRYDDSGSMFHGDAGQLTNYYSYGQAVYAVASGAVVEATSGRPENPAYTNDATPIPPTTMATVAGNYIVLDIGHGRFALYAHLQPKLNVRTGDRVKSGDILGWVGNSGNSPWPHLHFQLNDRFAPGTSNLDAEGVPYEFDEYLLTARCWRSEKCDRISPLTLRRTLPLADELVVFHRPR